MNAANCIKSHFKAESKGIVLESTVFAKTGKKSCIHTSIAAALLLYCTARSARSFCTRATRQLGSAKTLKRKTGHRNCAFFHFFAIYRRIVVNSGELYDNKQCVFKIQSYFVSILFKFNQKCKLRIDTKAYNIEMTCV